MADQDALQYRTFKFNNLVWSEPIYDSVSRCFRSEVKYNDLNKMNKDLDVVIQGPLLKVVSDVEKQDNGDLYLCCEFSKKYPEFYEFMYQFDQYVIKTIVDHSNEWFETQFKRYRVEKNYTSCVLPPTGLRRPPILRLKIQEDDLTEDLVKGCMVRVVMELDDIIFHRAEFYPNWIVHSLEIGVKKPPEIEFDNCPSEVSHNTTPALKL